METTYTNLNDIPEGSFAIPASNMENFQARMEQLQRKMARITKKSGQVFAPISYVQVGIAKIPRKSPHTDMPLPDRIYCVIQVTGPKATIDNYTFVATLQHEADTGTIIRRVPNVGVTEENLAKYRDVVPACEHCHLARKRNDSFVIRNDVDGTFKQVGRNCLQEFIGGKSPEMLARAAEYMAIAGEIASDFEKGGDGSGTKEVIAVEQYLPYVLASINKSGWCSRTKAHEYGCQATADHAWGCGAFPTPNLERKYRLEPTEQEVDESCKLLDWTVNDLENLDNPNEYQHNLSVCLMSGLVDWRKAGLVASLIAYARKGMGMVLEKQRVANSQHVGTVGKREVFANLTLSHEFTFETMYGVTHLYKFLDSNNNVVVWKSSKNCHFVQGQVYNLKATVKEHGEYKGVKQTVLTRSAVI